jgi:hypothetical protein
MKGSPQHIKFAEFIKIFRDRYVYKGGDGPAVFAVTSNEALLLSKYLFAGIIDLAPTAVSEVGGPSGLVECLERCALQNVGRLELKVHATDEELQALGTFLVRGLVGVFLVLDQVRVGLSPAGARYAGQ